MSLIKWSPMRELEEMRKEMERLFGDFFVEPVPRRWRRGLPTRISEASVVVPNVDMFERGNEVVLKAELPGMDRKDIDISLTKDSLTLKGEIKRDEEVKDEDYYCCERSYGSFTRTISLPSDVDTENVKASFKNGILEIVVPKKEEARVKEIKVDVQ